jgi:hypothetical protein
MTMQALPGSALEVIETEFFFQLLMSLLANPSRLDGSRQGAQVGLRRQIGEIGMAASLAALASATSETALAGWACKIRPANVILMRALFNRADSQASAILVAMMKSFSCSPLIFLVCSETVALPNRS